jgi:hypothetical protein
MATPIVKAPAKPLVPAPKVHDKNFPRWKYHGTKKPILVKNALDESKLGKEWSNSPADFPGHVESAPAGEASFDSVAEAIADAEKEISAEGGK